MTEPGHPEPTRPTPGPGSGLGLAPVTHGCEGLQGRSAEAWPRPHPSTPETLAGPSPCPGASRDTLKPKTLPCSCRSLFNRVLFPAPDGPLRTTGLGPDIPVDKGGKPQRDGRTHSLWKWVGSCGLPLRRHGSPQEPGRARQLAELDSGWAAPPLGYSR